MPHGGANLGGYDAEDRFQCAFNWRQPQLEAGMMKETVVPNGSSFGIEGINEYGYDADRKRVWKKITRSASIAEHTVYVYAGPNCIAEYPAGTAAASPTQEYVYAGSASGGPEIDSLVLLVRPQQPSGSDKYTITRNQQWSVTALAELASGTIVERYTYDHFGKRTILEPNGTSVRSVSSYAMPYGYTSRRHDAETDLMYFRARYYDPHTAEFISTDPLEYVDGMSLFRGYFVGVGVDPSGLQDIPLPTMPGGPQRPPVIGGQVTPAVFPSYGNPTGLPPNQPSLPRPTTTPSNPTPVRSPKPASCGGLFVFFSVALSTSTCHAPAPQPQPDPIGPRCPKNDCVRRHGYEDCPNPANTARKVAEDFLNCQGLPTSTVTPPGTLGKPTAIFFIEDCSARQPINQLSKECWSGGTTKHCTVGAWTAKGYTKTPWRVSVFVCNCCHETRSGTYTKPVGTPHGCGAPQWQSGSKRHGLDSDGNPTGISGMF